MAFFWIASGRLYGGAARSPLNKRHLPHDCHVQYYFAPGDTNVFTGPFGSNDSGTPAVSPPVDFLEKGLIVVYSVWLHRCRDFSVPTPSVARAQHRI
jgi:hypothetical protein